MPCFSRDPRSTATLPPDSDPSAATLPHGYCRAIQPGPREFRQHRTPRSATEASLGGRGVSRCSCLCMSGGSRCSQRPRNGGNAHMRGLGESAHGLLFMYLECTFNALRPTAVGISYANRCSGCPARRAAVFRESEGGRIGRRGGGKNRGTATFSATAPSQIFQNFTIGPPTPACCNLAPFQARDPTHPSPSSRRNKGKGGKPGPEGAVNQPPSPIP